MWKSFGLARWAGQNFPTANSWLPLRPQGFDALITVDKGFAQQQSMRGRKISVVLLEGLGTNLESLLPLVPKLIEELENLKPGELVRVQRP
jgi:hypothetical protein